MSQFENDTQQQFNFDETKLEKKILIIADNIDNEFKNSNSFEGGQGKAFLTILVLVLVFIGYASKQEYFIIKKRKKSVIEQTKKLEIEVIQQKSITREKDNQISYLKSINKIFKDELAQIKTSLLKSDNKTSTQVLKIQQITAEETKLKIKLTEYKLLHEKLKTAISSLEEKLGKEQQKFESVNDSYNILLRYYTDYASQAKLEQCTQLKKRCVINQYREPKGI